MSKQKYRKNDRPEEDLDKLRIRELVIKMKKLNEGHPFKMKASDIKYLPKEEHEELFFLIMRACRMVCGWSNFKRAVFHVASVSGEHYDEVFEDAVLSMTHWCMTYAWRNYDPAKEGDEPSKVGGMVFKCAEFGFKDWGQRQKGWDSMCIGCGFGKSIDKVKMDEDFTALGHKVDTSPHWHNDLDHAC